MRPSGRSLPTSGLGNPYSEPGQVQISFEYFRVGLFTAYGGVWLRKCGMQTNATVPMSNLCPVGRFKNKLFSQNQGLTW